MAFLLTALTLAMVVSLGCYTDKGYADVFLWPQPRFIAWGSGPAVPLAPSFYFKVLPDELPELRDACISVRSLIFEEKWVPVQVSSKSQRAAGLQWATNVKPLPYLTVTVRDRWADLQHGVNESYSLVIADSGGSGASLQAETVWGALHGIQTFSQLVTWKPEAGGLVIEHGVQITDAPLYGHRGIMLDVARNFYSVSALERTIRGMALNKLNVLHLHLTDSQSFPISLPSEPNLAIKGAVAPGLVYSVQDVQHLVAYARGRGVRLVPEIDMPGHSGSWGAAYPDIVTCRNAFWSYSNGTTMAVEPAPGQLNPLKEQTYVVAKNVIKDVAGLFPDGLFHGGGDEPVKDCWLSSADIAAHVQKGGSLDELVQGFVSRTHPYITEKNKTVVYWEDILLSEAVHVTEAELPRETTILETWNGGPINTKRLTSAGYRTIVASADFLYLDCGRGNFVGNDTKMDDMTDPSPGRVSYNYGGGGGSWCAPYKSWQRIYDYDIAYNLTKEEAALVLGAEAALWSEQADETVVDGLLWPRASALAESLWSGNRDAQKKRRSVEALERLNDWRYHMVARGIGAAPLQPLWCAKNPGQCLL